MQKYNNKYSRVVTHHSTDLALPSLAYKIERVCAFSQRYGRIWVAFGLGEYDKNNCGSYTSLVKRA